MSKIEVGPSDRCWNWQGAPTSDGYGRVFFYGDGSFLVHRLMWAWDERREITDGYTIDHLCRNRLCQNPLHLKPVPQGVNTLRGESPSAVHARKTACKRGHPFTEGNTYINPASKARVCLTCTKAHRQRQIPKGDHLCNECDRSFGSRRGLSIHKALRALRRHRLRALRRHLMTRLTYGQWFRQLAAARCAGVIFQDRRDGRTCPGCDRMHPDLPIMPFMRALR